MRRFAIYPLLWPARWGVATALVVCLATGCASRPGKTGNGAAAKPASLQRQPVEGPGAASMGQLISRSHVGGVDEPADLPSADTPAPSPGRELIAHALAGGGAAVPEEKARPGSGVPAALAERRIGVVRVIGAHGKFVLIETNFGYGDVRVDAGQELRSRGPAAGGGAQTALLKVSAERQPPFLVADVVSGEPMVGDVAYFAVAGKR